MARPLNLDCLMSRAHATHYLARFGAGWHGNGFCLELELEPEPEPGLFNRGREMWPISLKGSLRVVAGHSRHFSLGLGLEFSVNINPSSSLMVWVGWSLEFSNTAQHFFFCLTNASWGDTYLGTNKLGFITLAPTCAQFLIRLVPVFNNLSVVQPKKVDGSMPSGLQVEVDW